MAQTRPKPCLNPPARLYHATGAELAVGDIVRPGREVGRGRGQYVWLSAAPSTGWGVNVYEVEPLGTIEDARGWYRCREARVVRVVDPIGAIRLSRNPTDERMA